MLLPKHSTLTASRMNFSTGVTLWGTVITQISAAIFCFALKFGVVISQCIVLQCSENSALNQKISAIRIVFVVE